MRLIFKVQGAKDNIGTEVNQDGGLKVNSGLCDRGYFNLMVHLEEKLETVEYYILK